MRYIYKKDRVHHPATMDVGRNVSNDELHLAGCCTPSCSPQAENTAPQKCEADFRLDVAYSVGVRLSTFFADLGCELKREPHRPFALMSSRASSSVVVELLENISPLSG